MSEGFLIIYSINKGKTYREAKELVNMVKMMKGDNVKQFIIKIY